MTKELEFTSTHKSCLFPTDMKVIHLAHEKQEHETKQLLCNKVNSFMFNAFIKEINSTLKHKVFIFISR